MNPPQFTTLGPTGQTGYFDSNNQFIPMDKATFDATFPQLYQTPFFNSQQPSNQITVPLASNPFPLAPQPATGSIVNAGMQGTTHNINSPTTYPNSTNMGMFASNIGVNNNNPEIVNTNQVNPYIDRNPVTQTGTSFDNPLKKPEMPAKEGGLSGEQKGSLIGAGINMGSKLIRGLAQDRYDQRVGMEDPNAVGTILGDTTFTQMGSSIMPGIGTAIGGGLDLIKNIITFSKKKDAYNAGKRKADFTDYQRNLVSNRESDYTGLARHGIKAKNPYLRDYGKFSGKMKKR